MYMEKCPRNGTANKRKLKFLAKNGLNLKLSLVYFLLSIQYYFIVDVKSGRFMYQSRRAGDEAKKRKSPTKSGRVGITDSVNQKYFTPLLVTYTELL